MKRAKTRISTMLMLTLLAPTHDVKAETVVVDRSERPEDCTENSDVNSACTDSDQAITCPLLTCDPEASGGPPVPEGYCFMHDQQSPALRMSGALCYDITTARMSEPPMYCPFDIANEGGFMWMDEILQQQQGTDQKMLCKYTFHITDFLYSRSNFSDREEKAVRPVQDGPWATIGHESWEAM